MKFIDIIFKVPESEVLGKFFPEMGGFYAGRIAKRYYFVGENNRSAWNMINAMNLPTRQEMRVFYQNRQAFNSNCQDESAKWIPEVYLTGIEYGQHFTANVYDRNFDGSGESLISKNKIANYRLVKFLDI